MGLLPLHTHSFLFSWAQRATLDYGGHAILGRHAICKRERDPQALEIQIFSVLIQPQDIYLASDIIPDPENSKVDMTDLSSVPMELVVQYRGQRHKWQAQSGVYVAIGDRVCCGISEEWQRFQVGGMGKPTQKLDTEAKSCRICWS